MSRSESLTRAEVEDLDRDKLEELALQQSEEIGELWDAVEDLQQTVDTNVGPRLEAFGRQVAEYPGNQKDHLVVGDSDSLAEHAPAIAVSDVAEVEYLGTFDEFERNRGHYELDLPKTVAVDGEFTQMVGRERFWSVLWGDRDE